MSRWFRWYEGTSEDGKFRQVACHAHVTVATVLGVWAVLLEDASHSEPRGIATRGEGFWGALLDIDEQTLITILSAMEDANLISVGHGDITITKWKERQFEVDVSDPTAAERKRRERAKKAADATDTPMTRDVTVMSRPDTDTDTDTDTETDTPLSPPKGGAGGRKEFGNGRRKQGYSIRQSFQEAVEHIEAREPERGPTSGANDLKLLP